MMLLGQFLRTSLLEYGDMLAEIGDVLVIEIFAQVRLPAAPPHRFRHLHSSGRRAGRDDDPTAAS